MTPHTCPWLPHSTCSCDLWLSHKHGFHFDGKLLLHHKIFVCRVQNYSLWFSILILLLFEFFYFFSYTNFKHRQNIFYILPDNCSPKYDKAYWIWLTLTYFQGHSCPSLSLGRRGCLSFSERLVYNIILPSKHLFIQCNIKYDWSSQLRFKGPPHPTKYRACMVSFS